MKYCFVEDNSLTKSYHWFFLVDCKSRGRVTSSTSSSFSVIILRHFNQFQFLRRWLYNRLMRNGKLLCGLSNRECLASSCHIYTENLNLRRKGLKVIYFRVKQGNRKTKATEGASITTTTCILTNKLGGGGNKWQYHFDINKSGQYRGPRQNSVL